MSGAEGWGFDESRFAHPRLLTPSPKIEAQTKEAAGMITEEDKDTIIRCAKRYDVESVILHSAGTSQTPNILNYFTYLTSNIL